MVSRGLSFDVKIIQNKLENDKKYVIPGTYLNPISEGIQILSVGGGGASEAPLPKKSMMEWAETPCCYRHIVKV